MGTEVCVLYSAGPHTKVLSIPLSNRFRWLPVA